MLRGVLNEINNKKKMTKRRKSATPKVIDLEEMKKEKTKPKQTMTQMIVTGSLSNKFLELLQSPTSQLKDIETPSLVTYRNE